MNRYLILISFALAFVACSENSTKPLNLEAQNVTPPNGFQFTRKMVLTQ